MCFECVCTCLRVLTCGCGWVGAHVSASITQGPSVGGEGMTLHRAYCIWTPYKAVRERVL